MDNHRCNKDWDSAELGREDDVLWDLHRSNLSSLDGLLLTAARYCETLDGMEIHQTAKFDDCCPWVISPKSSPKNFSDSKRSVSFVILRRADFKAAELLQSKVSWCFCVLIVCLFSAPDNCLNPYYVQDAQ